MIRVWKYNNYICNDAQIICHAQDLWKLAWSCKHCIYYACQTHEIYQVLPYSVEFKAHEEFWNPLSKTALSKCSFIYNKGPLTSEMTVKLKSNLNIGPVNIFPNFCHDAQYIP